MLQNDYLKPQEYTFGDNYGLEVPASKYPPSSGYVCTLIIIPVSEGPSFSLTSDPAVRGSSSNIHLISFVGSEVAAFGIAPGDFRCQAIITLPSDPSVRTTLGYFDLRINPDFSANYTEGYDPRSYNEKCLDAIEKVLAGQSGRDLLEYTFKDATFKYKSTNELITLRNYFLTQVQIERGEKTGKTIIKPLFRPPYWGY